MYVAKLKFGSGPEIRRPLLQQSQTDRSHDLLMETHNGLTREELLQSVPSRTVVDRLVSRFFKHHGLLWMYINPFQAVRLPVR
jgi:hypothetical protein